ncbi:unnamed protein product [Paramecium octaurelia]|uniref:Uncharacterized protein n=1 Tax=Paramecium octaurelia TaxID=43137 RepID=A0A8S1YSM4_PAROT|nr:unnamed protein product [Paramecium octaurelia]
MMQSLGWTKHQLWIQKMLFLQVKKVIVQDNLSNMMNLKKFSIKHSPSILLTILVLNALGYVDQYSGICLQDQQKYQDALIYYQKIYRFNQMINGPKIEKNFVNRH